MKRVPIVKVRKAAWTIYSNMRKALISLVAFSIGMIVVGTIVKKNLKVPTEPWKLNEIRVTLKEREGVRAEMSVAPFSLNMVLDPKAPIELEGASLTLLIGWIDPRFLANVVPHTSLLTIRIFAPDFDISPESRQIKFTEGKEAVFALSPKRAGEHRIVVSGNISCERQSWFGDGDRHEEDPVQDLILPIRVREKPLFLGLGARGWSVIQVALATIGLPSLLTLIIKEVWDRRKKDRDDDKPMIILP